MKSNNEEIFLFPHYLFSRNFNCEACGPVWLYIFFFTPHVHHKYTPTPTSNPTKHGPLLKEKCLLELHIEHNLEGDLSHTAPDFCINGKLSSVLCRLDGDQYQLIRGLLNHNLGEKLEEFQRPPLSHLQNPKIQVCFYFWHDKSLLNIRLKPYP